MGVPERPIANKYAEMPTFIELEQLSRDFAYQLRIWDALEGKKREVIDFYLFPIPIGDNILGERILSDLKNSRHAKSTKSERRQRLEELRRISESLQNISPPESVNPQHMQVEFMAAKADGDTAYLERKLGLLPNNTKYIERTQGLLLEPFSVRDILAQKEIVGRLFKPINGDLNEKNFREYREETKVSPEDFIDIVLGESKGMIADLAEFLGVEPGSLTPPSVKAEIDNKEAYWLNWSNGNSNEFTFHLNVYHRMKITRGKALAMTAHEFAGHFAQMAAWLNAIKRDEMYAVLGLTCVHDPEQTVSEGIAQTLHHFVPAIMNRVTAMGEFELELEGLRQMVYNNLHVRANIGDPTDEELIRYVKRYLSTEPEDEIKNQIKDRRENTLYQSYLYAYGQGFFRLRNHALALSSTGKRRLLQFIYSQPLTPKQEERVFEALSSNSENISTPK